MSPRLCGFPEKGTLWSCALPSILRSGDHTHVHVTRKRLADPGSMQETVYKYHSLMIMLATFAQAFAPLG